MLTRPDRSEYADFYANYIARVPDGDVIAFLSSQPDAYRKLLGSSLRRGGFRAPAAREVEREGDHRTSVRRGAHPELPRSALRPRRPERAARIRAGRLRPRSPLRCAQLDRICSMNSRESASRPWRSSSPSRQMSGSARESPMELRLPCAPWLHRRRPHPASL